MHTAAATIYSFGAPSSTTAGSVPAASQAESQARHTRLITNLADFTASVQSQTSGMTKTTLVSLLGSAKGQLDIAQGFFARANAAGVWTRETEEGANQAMDQAEQLYLHAAGLSSSVGGPQAPGAFTATPVAIPNGGGPAVEPRRGTPTMLLVGAGVLAVMLAMRAKRR